MDVLDTIQTITIVIFMVGNLLEVGLRLKLREALENVKKLSGLIPICSNCKKIRTDEGFWQQVEVYIRDHSEIEFSHGLCPDCLKKLYPEFARDE